MHWCSDETLLLQQAIGVIQNVNPITYISFCFTKTIHWIKSKLSK